MRKSLIGWLIGSVLIAGGLSVFASKHPDGFEKAGEETGFITKSTSFFKAPLAEYVLPGIDSWISGSLGGIIGVLITFVTFLVVGKWIGKR